jgi:DNA-binding transcriptional LysR family regulator
VPHLPDFLAACPAIQVDAMLTDETVDLIASGADLAVGIGALADSTLVAKRLAPQRHPILPAGVPLPNRGTWRTMTACNSRCNRSRLGISCRTMRRRRNRWKLPCAAACAPMILRHCSTPRLPAWELRSCPAGWLTGEASKAGQLTPLLPEWEALIAPGPRQSIWAVPPPKKVVSTKVRAF